MDKLPIFFYPTKAILVDDEAGSKYLQNITFSFKGSKEFISFSNPRKAVDFIESNNFDKYQHSLEMQSQMAQEERGVQLDINSIYKLISDASRFELVSTIVCDYSMPEMNGIEFFRSISAGPAKRILLTGQAGLDIAVDALNAGYIDFFLEKTPSAVDILADEFKKADYELFNKFGELAYKVLDDKLFKSKDIIEFVSRYAKENNIVEYYFYDTPLKYLMIDRSGELHFLSIYHKDDIDDIAGSLKDYESVPHDVMQSIQNYKALPFLVGEDGMRLPPAEWEPFMTPVELITKSGDAEFYFSEIKRDSKDFDVYSYAEYLKS